MSVSHYSSGVTVANYCSPMTFTDKARGVHVEVVYV